MANPFDQFDNAKPAPNPFDQFDGQGMAPPPSQATVTGQPMSMGEQFTHNLKGMIENDPRFQAAAGVQEGFASLPGVPLEVIFGGGNFLRRQFGLPETQPEDSPFGNLRPFMSQGWIDFARKNGLIDKAPIPAPTDEVGRLARKAGNFGASAVATGGGAIPTASSFVGSEIGRAVDPGGYGETIGAIAGGLTPAAVEQGLARSQQALKYGLRGSDAGPGRLRVVDAINDATTAGTSPTVGQTGGSGFGRYFEGILKNVPGSVGTIKTALEDQASAIGDRVRQMADSLSKNADEVSAGQSGLRGIKTFGSDFRAKAQTLYNDLDSKIPAVTPVAVGNTLKALDDITTPVSGAKNVSETIASSKIGKIAEALREDIKGNPPVQGPSLVSGIGGGTTGSLPYQALKELRSYVGRQLGESQLVSELPRAELKKLYGAITLDMRRAAQQAGGPAINAFDRANTYYQAGLKRIDDHLERLSKLGAEPEKLFEALWRGRGGETFVQQVRRSLPQDDWKAIAATAVKRLGDARNSAQNAAGDVFSPETFLTRWNELSPSAKQAFFGGSSLGSLRQDLDAIARTADRIRTQAKVLHNSSGTTPTAVNVTAATAGAAALGTGNLALAAGIGAEALLAHVSARLMTNPKFVSWLAQTTRVPASQMASRLGQLSVIAANNPDLRPDIQAYLDGLSGAQAQQGTKQETQ